MFTSINLLIKINFMEIFLFFYRFVGGGEKILHIKKVILLLDRARILYF